MTGGVLHWGAMTGVLGSLGCWTGVLAHWGAGSLGCRTHWGTGSLGYWLTGVLAHWGTGSLGCWLTGVLRNTLGSASALPCHAICQWFLIGLHKHRWKTITELPYRVTSTASHCLSC